MLLRSLPRLDAGDDDRLAAIPGAPPDCLDLPPGCPFAERCECVVERCRVENPPLMQVGGDHRAACWVDPATRELR
jgi:oligopeptide/dipeptide ABC transporter ATP-binding protein